MLGQKLQDNIVLTTAPTAVTEMEILPGDIDIYLDPLVGNIGTTKLTRVLKATWGISDRFGTVWPLNSALESFGAIVETEPKTEIKCLVEADAAGMALLTTMRAGTTGFMRISCISDTLAGAATEPYSLKLDNAVKVEDVSEFSDEDGVYAIEWTFEVIADGGWGKAMSVALTNKITHIHTGGGS